MRDQLNAHSRVTPRFYFHSLPWWITDPSLLSALGTVRGSVVAVVGIVICLVPVAPRLSLGLAEDERADRQREFGHAGDPYDVGGEQEERLQPDREHRADEPDHVVHAQDRPREIPRV